MPPQGIDKRARGLWELPWLARRCERSEGSTREKEGAGGTSSRAVVDLSASLGRLLGQGKGRKKGGAQPPRRQFGALFVRSAAPVLKATRTGMQVSGLLPNRESSASLVSLVSLQATAIGFVVRAPTIRFASWCGMLCEETPSYFADGGSRPAGSRSPGPPSYLL
ncbi:hypothetical protein GQ53DRAFT_527593 [Thozetella sp. PMI_491]|nr:hypothetical protein GQ53DRAFT_527593 [Thozetella sp. PMI_491]